MRVGEGVLSVGLRLRVFGVWLWMWAVLRRDEL